MTETMADEGFPSEKQRQSIFSNLALQYDGLVRWTEFASGINGWRKKLVREAYGDVLELGMGTGRNLGYYRGEKVMELTGVDFSRSMLEVTDKKKKTLNEKIKLRLVCMDARKLGEKFPAQYFDCILDTFGLCSFEDPVAVLREAAAVLKDEGRLLLLEHGEADYEFMNKYLRKHLRHHVEKFGCYHDRPIRKIVEEAGFEIVETRKKHFGSITLLVCRKNLA
jgi:methyltransferase OMS1